MFIIGCCFSQFRGKMNSDVVIKHQNVYCQVKLLLENLLLVTPDNVDNSKKSEFYKKILIFISRGDAAIISIVKEWIVIAVPLWKLQRTQIDQNLATFSLKVAGQLSLNETLFNELNNINNNFYNDLLEITNARKNESSCYDIKLAYIKLVSNLLEHDSGIRFFVCNDFWRDILGFSLKSDICVSNEAGALFSKMLAKTFNYELCNEIVRESLLPLDEELFKSIIDPDKSINDDSIEIMQNSLKLINNTLEYFLEYAVLLKRNLFKLSVIFFNNFKLRDKLNQYLDQCNDSRLIFDLSKIKFIAQFINLYLQVNTNKLSQRDIKLGIDQIMNNFISILKRGTFEDVLKFCNFGQLFWKLMGEKIPCEEINTNYSYQFLFIQLLPILVSKRICYTAEYVNSYNILNDDFRDEFRQKCYKILNETTLRVAYHWQKVDCDKPTIRKFLHTALMYVLKSRKFYDKSMAIIVLQLIIYRMIDFLNTLKTCPEAFDRYLQEQETISLLFDVVLIFIEEFDINWRDCIEITDIMATVIDFLNIPNWPSSLVIKGLNMMNLAFKRFASPNLALLVDKTKDSALELVGPLICAKIQDEDGFVRDAALEIIDTMARNATTKFPSLQKVLMDSDLPGLVVKMATADGESFVRATAIKCLQEMIQVEEIWNNSLKSQDLAGKMRHILVNETEGIVRVEAATFMCISYENNQFPEETLDKIYETMIHSSTSDLHWEVKVRALNFWDKVINNHLQHQGMIDGSFPNVTFSKEHRKIVTLTDAEIKKRLTKVLGQLSGIGCLGVLISAIRDDCDMEVSKTAVKITQKLLELLKKYNINADSSLPVSPQSTDNGMSSSASISSGVSADDFINSPLTPVNSDLNEEVINQIVNSRDSTLLQNVYAQSDYGSVINYDMQVRKIVSPNEFLLFTQQDLNVIINEKKNWLNGIEDLGSLLDDMLKSYDDDDVNSMDCY